MVNWKSLLRLSEAKTTAIVADRATGFFGGAPFTPSHSIKSYYDYYNNLDSVVFAAVNSLADAAVGRGFDFEGNNKEAVAVCSQFAEKFNLDSFFPNIARNVLIAGFLPVESHITLTPEKCVLKMVHPQTVQKANGWNETSTEPTSIKQVVGTEEADLPWEDLAWFCWNKIGNNIFGTSQVAAVARYLSYKERAVVNMDKILERYSSPKGIWKSTGDISSVKNAVMSAESGQDLFLGNIPDDQLDKIVQFLDIDPRVRFWEYIQYLDTLTYIGLGSPNLFYFKDATEASGRVLLEIVDRNSYALGRMIKREAEAKWFTPLCNANGFEGEDVPKLVWRQKPGAKDLNVIQLIDKGLDKDYVGPVQFYELLKNLNVTLNTNEVEKFLKQKEAEKQKQAKQFQQQQPEQPANPAEQKPSDAKPQQEYLEYRVQVPLREHKHVERSASSPSGQGSP